MIVSFEKNKQTYSTDFTDSRKPFYSSNFQLQDQLEVHFIQSTLFTSKIKNSVSCKSCHCLSPNRQDCFKVLSYLCTFILDLIQFYVQHVLLSDEIMFFVCSLKKVPGLVACRGNLTSKTRVFQNGNFRDYIIESVFTMALEIKLFLSEEFGFLHPQTQN